MKFLVFSFLFLAFAAFVHNTVAEDVDYDAELPELHLVTPQEMTALGYADAARLRICIVSQCNSICRSLGYRVGRCTTNAYCVCFR